MWTIVSKDGYWSNYQGWVCAVDDATLFREEEKTQVNLPIGKNVRWKIVKENMKVFKEVR